MYRFRGLVVVNLFLLSVHQDVVHQSAVLLLLYIDCNIMIILVTKLKQ